MIDIILGLPVTLLVMGVVGYWMYRFVFWGTASGAGLAKARRRREARRARRLR